MPKVGMEPVRRRQVIDGTIACIHTEGLGAASLKAIARHAGVTPTLILHYFEDKDGVIEAVYRDLYSRLASETLRRLRHARTPRARLAAVLEAQVSPDMVEKDVVTAWFALSALTTDKPSLKRMERINTARLMSNMVHALQNLEFERSEARATAQELLAMVYGLWTLLAHGTIKGHMEATQILLRSLDARIPH